MESLHSIPTFRTNLTTNTVVMYLLIMGVLASCALALALLLFIAYLLQLLCLSIGELLTAFNSLDALVKLLLIIFAALLLTWRYSTHLKAKARFTDGC